MADLQRGARPIRSSSPGNPAPAWPPRTRPACGKLPPALTPRTAPSTAVPSGLPRGPVRPSGLQASGGQVSPDPGSAGNRRLRPDPTRPGSSVQTMERRGRDSRSAPHPPPSALSRSPGAAGGVSIQGSQGHGAGGAGIDRGRGRTREARSLTCADPRAARLGQQQLGAGRLPGHGLAARPSLRPGASVRPSRPVESGRPPPLARDGGGGSVGDVTPPRPPVPK